MSRIEALYKALLQSRTAQDIDLRSLLLILEVGYTDLASQKDGMVMIGNIPQVTLFCFVFNEGLLVYWPLLALSWLHERKEPLEAEVKASMMRSLQKKWATQGYKHKARVLLKTYG